MHAFVLHEAGSEPVFEDVNEPIAGPGQAAARVLAAGVNPIDLKRAISPVAALPLVVGDEAVVETSYGRGYSEQALPPYGSFAEQTLIKPAELIPMSDALSPEDGLAIGIAGLAAWLSLAKTAALQKGETVIVLGATGAVGRVAVQAARLLGAGRVIAAARNSSVLSSLHLDDSDATVTLEGGPSDIEALLDASGGGADVVLDPLFGAPLVTALHASGLHARVVVIGSRAHPSATIPFAALRGRSLLTYSNQFMTFQDKRSAHEIMANHLLSHDLHVDTEVLPLALALQAWRRQGAGPYTKLVLRP